MLDERSQTVLLQHSTDQLRGLSCILLGSRFTSGIFFSFLFPSFFLSFRGILSFLGLVALQKMLGSLCFCLLRDIWCLNNMYRRTSDFVICAAFLFPGIYKSVSSIFPYDFLISVVLWLFILLGFFLMWSATVKMFC